MSNPAVSVLLTTYQRPEHLKLAIKSVLNQDFDHFELIILDDASQDNTREIVLSFKDKRISYIKNKINLGFPANFRQGVTFTKGKYILLLSDDDLILESNTLSTVYKEMEKNKAGFGELGLIFYDNDIFQPYKKTPPAIENIVYFPPEKDILLKTCDWHFGFASGNIYRREPINIDDIIDDVWFSHVQPIYRLIKNYGALYFGNHHILGRISKSGNIAYLNIGVNKIFHMRKMFELYKKFDPSSKRLDLFIKKHLWEGAIANFAGIKYYTSNKNLINIAQEVIKIRPEYFYNVTFWINLINALLTPKFILKIIRDLKIYYENRKLQLWLKKINYEKKLSFILSK